MKKSLWTGVAVAALLAASGAANAQIKVGLTGPLTGPNAAFGLQLKNAIKDASALNAANPFTVREEEGLVANRT